MGASKSAFMRMGILTTNPEANYSNCRIVTLPGRVRLSSLFGGSSEWLFGGL